VATERRTESPRGFDLSYGEVTGALGDSVTVLPIVVALGALTPVSLAHVLAGFGVFQVVWGLRYRLPVSVEPMKALAGLAIGGALTYGELVAAGLLAGATLLAVGASGTLATVERYVGRSVVRGIQFAVALILLEAGVGLAVDAPAVGAAGLVLATAVALVDSRSAALAVLGVGVAWTVLTTGLPPVRPPTPALFPAGGPRLTGDALAGTAGQLAMTVGNAAVATSLLFSDLFDAEVASDDLATSMGAMSLVAVPLGALPMCHGSGGLAGKHAFGARTGAANLVIGALYLLAAPVAGLWLGFPMALLGALLVVVAAQLGQVALAARSPLAVGIGLLGLLTNVGLAFAVGVVANHASERWR